VPKIWSFSLTLIVAHTTALRTTVIHCDLFAALRTTVIHCDLFAALRTTVIHRDLFAALRTTVIHRDLFAALRTTVIHCDLFAVLLSRTRTQLGLLSLISNRREVIRQITSNLSDYQLESACNDAPYVHSPI